MKTSKSAAESEITLEIVCIDPPGLSTHGHDDVHLGIQKKTETVELQPADQRRIVFRPVLRVRKNPDGTPNFLGPFAQGPRAGRFIYLVWAVAPRKVPRLYFGRIKLLLQHISWQNVERAKRRGNVIKVTLGLTGPKGNPVFASVKPGWATWDL